MCGNVAIKLQTNLIERFLQHFLEMCKYRNIDLLAYW